VALTLALGRRPQLLVLDEPVAMLDPIARHDFMATVLAAASADGMSVLLSSHVLTELERVAGAVAADGLGHLAAAPLRAGRRGRVARRPGALPVAYRPSGAPRLHRRDRLPPGKLGH
jgi:energy-coupling factor transporter ATP-binding protein EcfA2